MLVDDLRAMAPDKLDCEIVERSYLALEPNSIRQGDGYLNSILSKVVQELVLKD